MSSDSPLRAVWREDVARALRSENRELRRLAKTTAQALDGLGKAELMAETQAAVVSAAHCAMRTVERELDDAKSARDRLERELNDALRRANQAELEAERLRGNLRHEKKHHDETARRLRRVLGPGGSSPEDAFASELKHLIHKHRDAWPITRHDPPVVEIACEGCHHASTGQTEVAAEKAHAEHVADVILRARDAC